MVTKAREYRKAIELRAAETDDFVVEGYATTFNDPYVMFEMDGIQYKEEIDRHAFDEADMTDVIFQFDHEGRVYARQKNGTLFLSVDDHGLHIRADLSKTEGSRQMYEDIKAGLISEMSFAFTVKEDSYDNETRTRKITKIKKVYDVSAVSIPANPSTEISARDYFNGVIEAEKAERLLTEQRNNQKAKIKLLCDI